MISRGLPGVFYKRKQSFIILAASAAMLVFFIGLAETALASPPQGYIQKRFSGALRAGGRKSIWILCRLSNQTLRRGTEQANGSWRLSNLDRDLLQFTVRSRGGIMIAAQSWCGSQSAPSPIPTLAPTPRGPSPTPSPPHPPGRALVVHNFEAPPADNFAADPVLSKNIEWDGGDAYHPTYDFDLIETYELGIVALWHMDGAAGGKISDASGQGFDGSLRNGNFVSGKFGKALSLSSGGGLDTETSPILGTSPGAGLSFGAWINPRSLSGRIVERAYDDFSVRFDASNGAARLSCRIRKSPNEFIEAAAPAGTNLLNRWSHILCVLDPSTRELQLYLDGVKAAAVGAELSSFATTWTDEFTVGNRVGDVRAQDPELFNGLIDEAAVWGRAISGEEAAGLAQATRPLAARGEAALRSSRVSAGEPFSDVSVSWLADSGDGAMFVSTDGGQSWCRTGNGDPLSLHAGACSLPASSIIYKYVFYSGSKLRQVALDFKTGVAERYLPANPIGLNLAEVADYSTDLVFKDAFKTAREWMTRTSGSYEWDSGLSAEIPKGPGGFPAYIPFPASNGSRQTVHTIAIYGGSRRPVGDYSLRFQGQGQLEVSVEGPGGGSYAFSGPGTYSIKYPSEMNSVFVRINSSMSRDPIRNIRLIYPEFAAESNAEIDAEPFTPQFLDSLRGAKVIRFMDWMRTNNQSFYSWADRTTAASYTQAGARGMSVELMVALANSIDADPWFTLPHLADDSFMRQFAEYLRDNLAQGRRAYVEFSNELWNDGFSQAQYAASQPTGRARWVAERAVNMFSIFSNILGPGRIVKVIAGQAAGPDYNSELLAWARNSTVNPNHITIDALAVAPYVGNSIPNSVAATDGEISLTSEGILDRLESLLKTDFINYIQTNLDLAVQHGVRLIAYEGGHHLAPIAGEENNDALVARLKEANRSPRMAKIYRAMLSIWAERVGDLFTVFSSTGAYTKWNMWGLKEAWNEGLGDAPKYKSVREALDQSLLADGAASTCGNNIAEPGEECDGPSFRSALFPAGSAAVAYSRYFTGGPLTCAEDCRVSTSEALPIPGCSLSGASWDDDGWTESKLSGQRVKLVVEGLKCLHEFLDVEIYEERGANDRLAQRLAMRFDEDGLSIGAWLTSLAGSATSPARFYFKARLTSDPSVVAESGLLTVCAAGGCP